MRSMFKKLKTDYGGINRLVVLFLVIIAVLIVIIAIPAFQDFKYHSECIACEQAMKSVKDGLIIEYLGSYKNGTVQDAQVAIDEIMPGREDNVCPEKGTVYLVPGVEGIYEPVCGLHDPDTKQRTRLNGSYAKDLLENERKRLKKSGLDDQGDIEIEINGKKLICQMVDQDPGIRWGTNAMVDYDGIVAVYGVTDDDQLSFFEYADENHAAAWSQSKGWTGDAYS